ncbi:hypothetical protein, partial [Arsenophonus sp. ENCA]|uniref:hypothetical protein n=1 Tax=Arsenophonus sp. ENCA TaxID=1987579 RepID=UPI0025BA1140
METKVACHLSHVLASNIARRIIISQKFGQCNDYHIVQRGTFQMSPLDLLSIDRCSHLSIASCH